MQALYSGDPRSRLWPFVLVCIWLLVGLSQPCGCASHLVEAIQSKHGYCVSLQGDMPILSLRNGPIDFEDEGFREIDKAITIAMWAKELPTSLSQGMFLFSWVNKLDTNYFQPLNTRGGFAFATALADVWPRDLEWHHYAATCDEGILKIYVDGVLSLETLFPSKPSLRGTPGSENMTTFFLGSHLSTWYDEPVYALRTGFSGLVDDVSIFSRALGAEDVVLHMHSPPNKEQAGSDQSLILHYDFDVECPQNMNQGLISTQCTVIGNDLVRNLGKAGRKYDLLVGKMNNDFGFGETWAGIGAETCSYPVTFDKPLFIPSTVPYPDSFVPSEKTPVVIQINGEQHHHVALDVRDNLGENVRFTLLPAAGKVLFADTNDTVALGSRVVKSRGFVFQAPMVFDQPVLIRIRSGDGSSEMDFHIWPFEGLVFKPGFDINQPTLTIDILEDKNTTVKLMAIAVLDPSGGRPIPVISELPKTGKVYQYDTSTGKAGKQITAANVTVTDNSVGAVVYSPPHNVFGPRMDIFKARFYSSTSGLSTSQDVTIVINIVPLNDEPHVFSQTISVEEDNTTGVEITLSGDDAEQKPGFMIYRLPSKGKLYRADTMQEITASFGEYDFVSVKEQYASRVLNVSSFWGNPPSTGYHPLGILGPPTCGERDNMECHASLESLETLDVGALVNANRFFADPSKDPVLIPFWVTKVLRHGENAEYSLKSVFMQRLVAVNGTDFAPCIMQGLSYPKDCNIEEASTLNEGVLNFETVPITALSPVQAGVWCPLNRANRGNLTMDGGLSAAAFGDEYRFLHNQALYYENSSPPYTEYIEVGFDEEVVPLALELGSSRGTGAWVSFKGFDEVTRDWVRVYSGLPQSELHDRSNAVDLYHRIAQPVCHSMLKTRKIRIELDTSDETGISDWNYIDYVKLTGYAMQQNSLFFQSDIPKLIYVPNPDQYGMDSFQFKVADCLFSQLRFSKAGTIHINIEPTRDKPRAIVTPLDAEFDKAGRIIFSVESMVLIMWTNATDVDNQLATLRLLSRPRIGHLYAGGKELQNGDVFGESSSLLVYTRVSCSELRQTIDSFVFEAIDPDGDRVKKEVQIRYDCRELPKQHEFEELSSGASIFAATLGVVGVFWAIGCLAFTIYYRDVPLIKMSSPNVNIVVIIGTMLVYTYLITYAVPETSIDACQGESFWGKNATPDWECHNEDNKCCDVAAVVGCQVRIWLLVLGIILVLAPLITKTIRVHKIFRATARLQKVEPVKDSYIFKLIILIVAVAIVILILWTTLSPPSLRFSLAEVGISNNPERIQVKLRAVCDSEHQLIFLSVMLFYLAMLLLYGAILAVKIRKVFVKEANESRSLAFSIYNILTFGTIGLLVAYLVEGLSNQVYIITMLVFIATTLTLLALFFPRMASIARGDKSITLNRTSSSKMLSGRNNSATTHGSSFADLHNISWRNLDQAANGDDQPSRHENDPLRQLELRNLAGNGNAAKNDNNSNIIVT